MSESKEVIEGRWGLVKKTEELSSPTGQTWDNLNIKKNDSKVLQHTELKKKKKRIHESLEILIKMK